MLRAIRRYSQAAPKVLALSRREWRELLAAQLQLLRAQLHIWTTARGALLTTGAGAGAAVQGPAPRLDDACGLALAIGRAAEFGVFRPACLARSIALCRLLDSRGIFGGRVQIGVMLRDGSFLAHAWVEYAGQVLGDDQAVASRYASLSGLNVPSGKVNWLR